MWFYWHEATKKTQWTRPKPGDEPPVAAAPAASHPGDDAPIDEGQWGGMGAGGVWDDEEAELAGAGFHMAQHPGAEIVLAGTWEENWD